MDDDGIHELAPGYALDALDPAERRAFEGHLPECEGCRQAVASFGEAAAALAYAAEGPVPPAELRGRILEAARAERDTVVPLHRRRPGSSRGAARTSSCPWGGR